MAKASDNPFPSILLVEQAAAPATPAAGEARLYRGTDGVLYVVDDVGAVSAVDAGGGGGTSVRVRKATRTSGNITLPVSTAWAEVAPLASTGSLDMTMPASVGDWIEVGVSMNASTASTETVFDFGTLVSSAIVNRVSGTGLFGVQAWTMNAADTSFKRGGSVLYQLLSGDISGGNVTMRFLYRNPSATRVLKALTDEPLHLFAKNLGAGT